MEKQLTIEERVERLERLPQIASMIEAEKFKAQVNEHILKRAAEKRKDQQRRNEEAAAKQKEQPQTARKRVKAGVKKEEASK